VKRLVADASAVVDLLAGAARADAVGEVLRAYPEIDVPEHFHVEALSALRGLRRRGDLTPERADRAIDLLIDLRVVRHAVAPHARALWALRDNLSANDAAYLVVARAIDARLLTTDAGLRAMAQEDGRAVALRA